MKEEKHENFSNGWKGILILAALFDMIDKEASQLWEEFKTEIKTQNRFSPTTGDKIYKLFQKVSEDVVFTLNTGTILFRARVINSELPNYVKLDLCHIFGLDKLPNENELLSILGNTTVEQKKQLHEKAFWGFDEKDSDAPASNISAGRINPQGIGYLYAAEDVQTAVAEMRPMNKQLISVAKIKITQPLKLFDFCKTISDDGNKLHETIMFQTISSMFSSPNYDSDTSKYYTTQYLSERLKKDYHGIRFSSSLNEGGKNIVLFETTKSGYINENYKVISSSVHRIENILVTESEILPYTINTQNLHSNENAKAVEGQE